MWKTSWDFAFLWEINSKRYFATIIVLSKPITLLSAVILYAIVFHPCV